MNRIVLSFMLSTFCLSIIHSALAQKRKRSEAANSGYTYPNEALKGLKYRSIGPYRGGRVTAVEGIQEKPYTFLMGSTGGGVWKTSDAGETWQNISDGYFKVGSIGAIEVADADANKIYVGTGSACIRGNISIGRGVYVSEDAGASWTLSGLEQAGQIAKIIAHPKNEDLVFVAALGNPFGKNEQRGVFRSSDGGQNWEKVLYHSDSVGAIDLVMDPTNPRILYAGMWRAERKPWTMIDGSTEGGLYKSMDGGDTWKKLTNGLPSGLGGRIGLAIAPTKPDRIWYYQETAVETDGGIYRSDDGGMSFTKINREHLLRQRAWYYTHIHAHPTDENTVYVNNTGFYKSVDGGTNFSRISTPHGDNHGLWINPDNPDIMIQCNDGGANVSFNGGKTWGNQFNQPTAEFYRVTVDNQFPYRVYGAQQDNSTLTVPSKTPGGVTPKEHWYAIGGGESGHIAVDPRDPNIVYSGNYIGQIDRVDLSKGHKRNVVAYPQMHDGVAPRHIKYRFQWNAPIRLSPHNPDVLYHCSQYVHKSTDGGQTWEVISPDLTTNKDEYQNLPGGPIQHDHTGVELYTTIFSFEESPHNEGELWAGTDDGFVHISRDGGTSWTDITPTGMPYEGTVNTIDLSAHKEGRAYVTVYRYRDNDFRPHIFFTDDWGTSWRSITSGIPNDHFVRVVREDPNREGLLYAGTEFGMYISFDNGNNWQSFQLNLPVTPITDMLIKEKDLVISTQGRSFWILDDLSPLYEMSQEMAAKPVHLFEPRTAYRTQMRGFFRGSGAPERPPFGALIYYYLNEKPTPDDTVRLDIMDARGETVKVFSTHPDKSLQEVKLNVSGGLNRFEWNMTGAKPEILPGSFMSLSYTGGHSVPPGNYGAQLSANGETQSVYFEVKKDPRWEQTDADLKAQHELVVEVMEKLNETHDAIHQIRSVRSQAKEIAKLAVDAGYNKEISGKADELFIKLTAIEDELIQSKNESGQDPINYPPKLDDQFAYLYSTVNAQDSRPTEGAYERFEDLKKELSVHLKNLDDIMGSDFKDFNGMLDEEGVSRIIIPKR